MAKGYFGAPAGSEGPRIEEMMTQLKFSGASFGHTEIYSHSVIICELLIRIYFTPVKITKLKRLCFQT